MLPRLFFLAVILNTHMSFSKTIFNRINKENKTYEIQNLPKIKITKVFDKDGKIILSKTKNIEVKFNHGKVEEIIKYKKDSIFSKLFISSPHKQILQIDRNLDGVFDDEITTNKITPFFQTKRVKTLKTGEVFSIDERIDLILQLSQRVEQQVLEARQCLENANISLVSLNDIYEIIDNPLPLVFDGCSQDEESYYGDAFRKGLKCLSEMPADSNGYSIYERLIAIPLSVQEGLRVNCVNSARMTSNGHPGSEGYALQLGDPDYPGLFLDTSINADDTTHKKNVAFHELIHNCGETHNYTNPTHTEYIDMCAKCCMENNETSCALCNNNPSTNEELVRHHLGVAGDGPFSTQTLLEVYKADQVSPENIEVETNILYQLLRVPYQKFFKKSDPNDPSSDYYTEDLYLALDLYEKASRYNEEKCNRVNLSPNETMNLKCSVIESQSNKTKNKLRDIFCHEGSGDFQVLNDAEKVAFNCNNQETLKKDDLMKLYESTSRNYTNLRNDVIERINPICVSHANKLFDKLSHLEREFQNSKEELNKKINEHSWIEAPSGSINDFNFDDFDDEDDKGIFLSETTAQTTTSPVVDHTDFFNQQLDQVKLIRLTEAKIKNITYRCQNY